ncbi:MAG TPA: rhodanese-like domain-containing protein [Xanthobacteraceae bacterium]|nr:rhodanese-like domain-containing protein [Xanthobacteraceae bacterium]
MADVSPLVSTEWLAAHLDDAMVRVVDIRSAVDGGARAAFEQAHVPGAVHTDYAKEGWRRTQGMASGLLPEPGTLARLIGQLDVTPEHHVVIVAAGTTPGDFSAAARVYWTFKTAGHHAVSILDGGMVAWTADRHPVEAGAGKSPVAATYPVALDATWRAERAAVERAVAAKDAILLDTRSAPYFEGRDKSPQALRAGRLPGALHLDHTVAFEKATQRLKPLAELQRLFAAVPDLPVISYCNTGHQAATSWFVLSEVLRRPGVTLYDGSMSEWTEEPARAVETGPAA